MTPPKVQLPHGDTTTVEAFATPVQFGPGWGLLGYGLGTPTNHPTEAFASARKRGDGIIDLGASGSSEGPGADAWGFITADLFTSGRVTNTGTYGGVALSHTIPLIEIGTGNNRYDGVVAEVDVDYVFAMYDVNDNFLFDFSRRYSLTYEHFKPPTTFAIQTFTPSEDLLNDGSALMDVTNCFLATTCGKAVGPFTITREYVLDTGDYMKWEIHSSVFQVTGREGGGHALYGDPLSIAGGGSSTPHSARQVRRPCPSRRRGRCWGWGVRCWGGGGARQAGTCLTEV